jgi:hypothetical protein
MHVLMVPRISSCSASGPGSPYCPTCQCLHHRSPEVCTHQSICCYASIMAKLSGSVFAFIQEIGDISASRPAVVSVATGRCYRCQGPAAGKYRPDGGTERGRNRGQEIFLPSCLFLCAHLAKAKAARAAGANRTACRNSDSGSTRPASNSPCAAARACVPSLRASCVTTSVCAPLPLTGSYCTGLLDCWVLRVCDLSASLRPCKHQVDQQEGVIAAWQQ